MLLETFWANLSRCHDRPALAETVQAELLTLFGASRARVFFFDAIAVEGFAWNPVMDFLRTRECPVHEAQLVDNDTWRRYCPRADHGHVLVGPLLAAGELVGAAAVTRTAEQGTFREADVQRMTRLSLRLSCRLSELGRGQAQLAGLTPREREVAALVARGLANAAIGARLNVSEQTVKQFLNSVFRKLGVRSRAQLAGLVASGG